MRATLPRFDTQAYPGNEVWKIMSGAASLHGTLDALAFLAPAGGGPRLARGGVGTVRARVALRDGRGSARLDAEASAVLVKLGERTVRSAIRANVFARRIDFPGGSVSFDGIRLRLREVSLEGVAGAPWNRAVDMHGPPKPVSFGRPTAGRMAPEKGMTCEKGSSPPPSF